MKTVHTYFDGGTIHGSFKVFIDSPQPSNIVFHQEYDMVGLTDSNQAELTVLLRSLRWLHIYFENSLDGIYLKLYGDCSTAHEVVGTKKNGFWVGNVSSREDYNYLAGRIRERLDRFGGFQYNRVQRKIIKEMLGH